MSWNVIKYKHYFLYLDPDQTEFVFFWKPAFGILRFLT